MAAPHTCILMGKKLPEVIFPDHNYQPKLKAEAGFVRKSVVFFSILYLYHDKFSRYDLMEEFTETFGPHTYRRIVKVSNVQKNISHYSIEYDKTKSVTGGLDFCEPCTEFPRITLVKNILRRSVDRAIIIDYIFNEVNKAIIIRNKNK